jgi:ribosomal protein S12 methylthiotransferase accessory factor
MSPGLATAPRADAAAPATSAAPVRFRGVEHRARKRFWEGTQRTVPPSETLATIRRHFAEIGLVRLADVTGLDRIGVHTVLAVRPNARYLSVDAGKGFSLDAAKVSAAMEAIERYSAETADLEEIRCPLEEAVRRFPVVPPERLALAKDAFFTPRLPVRWTLGWDLLGEREVAAPALSVAMCRPLLPGEVNPFQGGTNGLSAGNNFLEALCGGLLELVERDAVACQRVAWSALRDFPSSRVDLATVESPLVRDLLERLERVGTGVVLFDCTVDLGVPVYMAYLFDRANRHVGVYRGYGAHLDPAIAMVRALTEAVQGRLVFISGSRDDHFRHDYLRLRQSDGSRQVAQLEAIPAVVDARARPSLATDTFEGDVGVILDRLRRAEIGEVLVWDLTLPGFEVSALRVMVPGLEGYMYDFYTPGPRARAFVEAHRK